MKSQLSHLAVAALFAIPFTGFAQPSRITRAIDPERRAVLHSPRNPRITAAADQGALDPLAPVSYMRIALQLSAAQSADLEQLLEAQRDPSSSDYQRWLTPEEFGERFGASQDELAQLTAWLASEGFNIEQTARARNWIAFSGTASQVAHAFHTELRRYRAGGQSHFANANAPSVPEALAGIVGEIKGLNDFRLLPPRAQLSTPDLTTASGAHYLSPDDLAAIYNITPLYAAGYTGKGQKIAIVGQSAINLSDMRAFRSQFGLPASDPQLVLYGPNPGVSSGDQIESDLDLQWAGAVARGATILFVYSQDVMESVTYAIDQNLAPVISMSYGGCELGVSASNRMLAQQANAEGITWLNSSGDSGAAGCDWGGPTAAQYGPAVTFPADIPEVTAVGGTEFSESGNAGWNTSNTATWQSVTGYLPEKAWNDTSSGGGIWASGGGVSTVFPKPWWQAGPGVPADKVRDVPDISLTASGGHDAYVVAVSGQLLAIGGTSASSPSFAGIVAILNQYVVAKGIQTKPGLGNINPTLYSLAQNTTGVIHDVTSGNNIVPCAAKSSGCPASGSFGYSAGAGYDLVTGLGSVDANSLVTKWASIPTAIGTTTALTASAASIAPAATVTLTAKVTPVGGTNAPTGSVNFISGSVTLGSAVLIASGSSASATLTVKGSALAVGKDTITANYAASGSFSSSSGTVTVTVASPLTATSATLSANPTTLASTASTVLTVTIKAASGSASPTGSVTFTSGNSGASSASLGSATLSGSGGTATATLTLKGTSLTAGANVVNAAYAGDTNFSGSNASVNITVTVPTVATTATVTANPASIAQSASTTLTATVKASSGTQPVTGSVTFSLGNTTLGSATLGSAGTATLSVPGSKLNSGPNTITATYAATPGFGASSGTASVTVTVSTVATTTTVTANPASIAQSASTTLTATVKASTGTQPVTGSVTFSLGDTALGSATLGSAGTATLSVPGSKLKSGSNTITASYAATTGFGASSGTVSVTITGATAAASNVVATATRTTNSQPGFAVKLQLQETGGAPTTITGLTINGTNFSSVIGSMFGSTQLAAKATATSTINVQWSPLPATLTFVFTGADASGRQWTQTVALATK